jgi:hypothetical protein
LFDPRSDIAAVVLQKLLREANCRRRQGTHSRHHIDGNVDQRLVLDDTVDKAPPQRRLCIDRLTEFDRLTE